MHVQLRIIPVESCVNGCGVTQYYVQRRVKWLSFLYRWDTIGVFNNYGDALMFKTTFVPKDVFENNMFRSIDGSYRFYKLHKNLI